MACYETWCWTGGPSSPPAFGENSASDWVSAGWASPQASTPRLTGRQADSTGTKLQTGTPLSLCRGPSLLVSKFGLGWARPQILAICLDKAFILMNHLWVPTPTLHQPGVGGLSTVCHGVPQAVSSDSSRIAQKLLELCQDLHDCVVPESGLYNWFFSRMYLSFWR